MKILRSALFALLALAIFASCSSDESKKRNLTPKLGKVSQNHTLISSTIHPYRMAL